MVYRQFSVQPGYAKCVVDRRNDQPVDPGGHAFPDDDRRAIETLIKTSVGARWRKCTPVLTVVQNNGNSAADDSSAGVRSLLDEIVRDGDRKMLAAALQAEVAAYIEQSADHLDENGHRQVVRNGYRTERDVLTTAGASS